MSDLAQRIAALSPEKREILLRQLNQQQAQHGPQSIPRRDDQTQPVPLSFAQESLWLVNQLAPESAAYNVPCALRLQGPLDLTILGQSLQEIISRHESLRTTLRVVEDHPAQIIAPTLTVPIVVTDLQALAEEARQQRISQHIDAEMARPFDLAQGPLLRVTLLRLAEQEALLLVIMHHIITDAWSSDVFVREITALYDAFSAGKPSPLPALPIHYPDYALWQRERLSAELPRLLDYWKARLDGAPAILEIPGDHPRPLVNTFQGASFAFHLPPALSEALRTLSQQEQASLFMTMLATFQVLLARYTGREDIVVGSPIANRSRPELEGVIGYLVNMLVLRTDLSGAPSFRQLLQRVRGTALEAYTHQELPFEKLVEALHTERSLSYNPFFQTIFALEEAAPSDIQAAGVTWQWVKVASASAKVDLSLNVQEGKNGFSGFFEYSTDLFETATIERLYRHWLTLLEGIVANPDQSITTLPLLTEAECQQMLIEWNATQAPYPADQCFHQLFETQAARTPQAIAVYCAGQRLTYRELNERANQVAHHLRGLGVGPEVLVGLCLERSVEMLVGLFGILKAGGAYVPLDPTYPTERLAFMLEDSQAAILVTQTALLRTFPLGNLSVVCLDRDWPVIAQQPQTNPDSGVRIENLAYMIYTSGSTGKPKGVLVTHRGVPNLAAAERQAYHIVPESRILQVASFGFDASVADSLMALPVGGTLYIATEEERIPGPALLRLLQEEAITIAVLTPAAMAMLPEVELPALQVIISAGEACSAELVARWSKGRRFFNAYGPTEATVAVTLAECTESASPPPIGRPLPNTQVYVLDPHLQPVPIGVPGELYLGGVGLARGYHHRPELTAEKFIKNPFSTDPHARLYRTGDLGYWRADGMLEFLGRIDQQVKLRGFRIELGEIEALLLQHPAVREAVVMLRKDTPGNQRLVAYLVLQPEHSITYREMRAFLKNLLPEYMLPSACIVLDALPVNTNGKVDRKALPRPDAGGQAEETSYVAPTQIEHYQLLGIWEELLDARPIGINDNFFLLGGYSLLAARMLARIEEVFGKKLPLTTLFAGPTIADIVNALQQQPGGNDSLAPMYTIQTGEARRPLFFLHGALDGGGFYCYRLAHSLGADQPFYALQPYRLEGLRVPPTFEEMAQAHLDQMRTVQPEGPYLLGGVCNGALVATELARVLQAQGQTVKLLVLVDPTLPNTRFGLVGQRISYFFGRLLGHNREQQLTLYLRTRHIYRYIREAALQAISPGFRKWVRQYRGKPNRLGLALPKFIPSAAELREDWQTIFHCIMPGDIPHFQAEQLTFFWTNGAAEERAGWKSLTEGSGVTNHTLPGIHFEWTDESISALAEQLSAYLKDETHAHSTTEASRVR